MTDAAAADGTKTTTGAGSLNAIDADLAAIEDPAIRRRLSAAFDRLRERTQYGLVFERHRPEAVVLHGQQVVEGRFASDRSRPSANHAVFVEEVNGKTAVVRKVDEQLRPVDDKLVKMPVADLVLLARFGEPIFPGLVQTGEVCRGGDKPFHTVINGENFHALETLLFAYEGKVDAIYIDPPYNTRANDWKYNNDYVQKDDFYKHSKWLAFMERRLKLAKRLLFPENSVLIVTIDETEYLRLGMLLEQVFPGSYIEMVTSVISAKGVYRRGHFSRVEEHIFYVCIGDASIAPWNTNMLKAAQPDADEGGEEEGFDAEDEIENGDEAVSAGLEWLGLRRREPSSIRGARPNQFYPIFVRRTDGVIRSIGKAITDDVDRHDVKVPAGTVALWPLKPDGTEMLWGLTPEVARRNWKQGWLRVNNWKAESLTGTVQYLPTGAIELINSGKVTITGKRRDGSVEGFLGAVRPAGVTPKRVWNVPAHNAENGGTKILSRLLPGRRFPYPKSVYAVEDAVRFAVGGKPDALVLDFFAGSGTTAHAVMRLNRQDAGRRRTIIVTNNEASLKEQAALRKQSLFPGDPEWEAQGICEYITKPRIAAAITGKRPDGAPVTGQYTYTDVFPISDGFEENARFFNLVYLDPDVVEAKQAFEAVAPLLWLCGGATGPMIEKEPARGWALPVGGTYGILFSSKGRRPMANALAERDGDGTAPVHVFIVADTDDEYHRSIDALGLAPERTTRLYRDYLRNFRANVTMTGED